MNLFTVNSENEVDLNVPWIKQIPEFKALFVKKNGKVVYARDAYARKLLSFIYFMWDFSSPIRNWDEEARQNESLKYAELEEADIKTDTVTAAATLYQEIQIKSCRALKTYRVCQKGLTGMDDFVQNLNFNLKDKMGKLLFTPDDFAKFLKNVNLAYDELAKLEERIQKELQGGGEGIRGKATLGDTENQVRQGVWKETAPEDLGQTKWNDISKIIGTDKESADDEEKEGEDTEVYTEEEDEL